MPVPLPSPFKVLVVEEDPSVRGRLAALLPRRLGIVARVTLASGAHEARSLVNREVYHLVLAGQGGARLPGVELLAAVYRRAPDAVRVLLVGPDDPPVSVASLSSARVDAVVRRPWEDARLLQGLAALLRSRYAPEAAAAPPPPRATAPPASVRRVGGAPAVGAARGAGRIGPPSENAGRAD